MASMLLLLLLLLLSLLLLLFVVNLLRGSLVFASRRLSLQNNGVMIVFVVLVLELEVNLLFCGVGNVALLMFGVAFVPMLLFRPLLLHPSFACLAVV